MNKEMSETLTRVGPGTRMGALMRRYWVPALMSSEIADADVESVVPDQDLHGVPLSVLRRRSGPANATASRLHAFRPPAGSCCA